MEARPGFGDRVTEEGYERRVATLLDNFWDGRGRDARRGARTRSSTSSCGWTPATASAPVVIHGSIDRIDRLPSGGIEVIDYKTGRVSSQKGVDESLQLSIYALACRDALGLGTPERVTLYFTESATAAQSRPGRTSSSTPPGTTSWRGWRGCGRGSSRRLPGEACRWCDYRAMCPERA